MGAEGGTRGWKLSNITAEEYVRLLKAYDAEIQKDDYILGATVFTSGPTPDWENYSMDGLEQYFIEEEPVPEPDGGMTRLIELRRLFPAKWDAWARAGGTIAQNFELYLIALGDLPKTWDAYDLARNKLISAVEEEREIMKGLRPL